MKEKIKARMKKAADIVDFILSFFMAIYLIFLFIFFIIISSATNNFPVSMFSLLIGIINFIFGLAIIINIKGITKSISINETPFIEENVKRLRRIACLSIITSFLPSYNFDFVTSVATFNFINFSFVGILAGLCVLALSFVFAYGCALQKSDDETL